MRAEVGTVSSALLDDVRSTTADPVSRRPQLEGHVYRLVQAAVFVEPVEDKGRTRWFGSGRPLRS
jgi:hypothetical protein